MLTRSQKEQQVEELRDKFARAKSLFVADYRGLNVAQVNALRGRIHHEGGGDYEYRVSKNTLLRRASEGNDAAQIVEQFNGPTAIALSYSDPVGLAKVLVDYAKKNQAFEIRGGLLEGTPVDEKQIATLATLPNLEELRAQLAGLLKAPARKLATLMTTPGEQVARVLDARRASLEESGGGA